MSCSTSWRWSVARLYVLVDRDSCFPFLGLVLLCGVALALSIPGAHVVQDLESVQHISHALGLDMTRIFLDAYVLCLGLLGLILGSASAERGERGPRMILWLALRVLLGQLLCLPYLVFSRALFPGRDGGLALVVLFATLTSLAFAVLNWLIEKMRQFPTRPLFGFAAFLALSFVPLGRIPLLSPIAAAQLLLNRPAPLQGLAAFAVPVALLVALSLLVVRTRGGARG